MDIAKSIATTLYILWSKSDYRNGITWYMHVLK